jgi:hypothetical protein
MSFTVTCPLCGQKKARRFCPALQKEICAVCCGTKRLVEIPCPADCPYLASAREHPAAAQVRKHERDMRLLVQCLRDLGDRQSELFWTTAAAIARYQPTDLHQVIDEDVSEAVGALAATYETASRGVIYEHRPASRPAEQLFGVLKAAFERGRSLAGAAFERDGAVVLRRIEEAVREMRTRAPGQERAFLELVGRVVAAGAEGGKDDSLEPEPSRLIVP